MNTVFLQYICWLKMVIWKTSVNLRSKIKAGFRKRTRKTQLYIKIVCSFDIWVSRQILSQYIILAAKIMMLCVTFYNMVVVMVIIWPLRDQYLISIQILKEFFWITFCMDYVMLKICHRLYSTVVRNVLHFIHVFRIISSIPYKS